METWKVMVAATVTLVGFAVVVSLTDVSMSGSTGLFILSAVAGASVMFYVTSRRGYEFGKRMGERMQDKD